MSRALNLAPILLVLAIALPGAATEPAISSLRAHTEGQSVEVSLRLDGIFDENRTIETLQSGLPFVVVYQIDLIRKHKNWFDSILNSSEIELVATYNSLTREYLLNYRRNRKLVSSESIRNIDDLRKRMSSIQEADLFEVGSHKPGKLRIRARALLGRRYVFHVIPRPVTTEWDVVRVQTRERQ